jgi:glycosyltransferase involved in cell wall biosynthesis
MRILFLMASYQVGGQENITNVMAHKFIENNHQVSIVCFSELSPIMVGRADKRIRFYRLNGFNVSRKNVVLLRKILIDEKTDVIINQWGLPFVPTRVAKRSMQGLPIKYISFYHNDPATNRRLKNIEQQISIKSFCLRKWLLKAKWLFVRVITGLSMNYVYKNSDNYVLFTKRFIEYFRKFAYLHDTSKVRVLPNPLTIEVGHSNMLKQNEILYVGRLENIQKRIDRILDIWALLHATYNDWKLTIVGDGEDRQMLEKKAEELQLQNIEFTGYKIPDEYFKRASILLLTSDYEGFPLVLAEAMSYAVVPVAYGSYAAVYDIIDNGKNGIIVPLVSPEFAVTKIYESLKNVLEDSLLREKMSCEATKISEKFSVDEIYRSWMKIIEE